MKKALLVVSVVGATVVASGPASTGIARVAGFSTTVKITRARPAGNDLADYKGYVGSPQSGCKHRRKVHLYHDSKPRFLIGTDITDSAGRWEIEDAPAPPVGEFIYAVVAGRDIVVHGHHRHCDSDRSPRVEYPDD